MTNKQMKQVIIMIVLLLSMGASNCVLAGTKKDSEKSYNLQRGMELIDNKDFSEAQKYIEKEIADNPKNGLAYLMLSMVLCQQEEYGDALESCNKAIKFTSSKDKEHLALAYSTRFRIHRRLGMRL